ncbi:MAG: hypothetical protein V1688_01045 [bacterium]
MKNLKNKINFLFCFSVALFVVVSFFHFLVINKKMKEAQAAGMLSIAGVTASSAACTPSSPCPSCSTGTTMVTITQNFGGDKLVTPILCIPPEGFLLSGRSLFEPGTIFLGGFTSVAPVAVQSGYTGSY